MHQSFYLTMVKLTLCGLISCLLCIILLDDATATQALKNTELDTLTYTGQHKPRFTRGLKAGACKHIRFENVTHTRFPASENTSTPLVETHFGVIESGDGYWNKRSVQILHQVISRPLDTLSVLEPGEAGSCRSGKDMRTLVRETAQKHQCIVAINAGLFNTHTGACLGNVVSDGVLAQNSEGIQNAHFGITKDGHIFTGYISEIDLLIENFNQLVGGVVWLVKDGVNFVDQSLKLECPDTQETGSLERFTTVLSGRVAIGHDGDGRVHLLEVNGKTYQRGMNLYEVADLLIKLGVVNAINLDGGGSATAVIHGTLVNFPSDQCPNQSMYSCERPVTTIVCVHSPHCKPRDCSGHGTCEAGTCVCSGLWTGPACDKLRCPADCSWHGRCTQDGCQCQLGWSGTDCSTPCQRGYYGVNCTSPCFCQNNATCNPVTGACQCLPGFSGSYCQKVCPLGYYGQGCEEVCFCGDSCFCDPVTGNCSEPSQIDADYVTVGQCLAKQEIQHRHLVPKTQDQSGLLLAAVVCLSVLSLSSLALNALLSLTLRRSRYTHEVETRRTARLAVKRALRRSAHSGGARPNSENDDEDDDNEDDINNEERGEFERDIDDYVERVNSRLIKENFNHRSSGPGSGDVFRRNLDSEEDVKTNFNSRESKFRFKSLWPNRLSPHRKKPMSAFVRPFIKAEAMIEGSSEQSLPLLEQSGSCGKLLDGRGNVCCESDEGDDIFVAPLIKYNNDGNKGSMGSK